MQRIDHLPDYMRVPQAAEFLGISVSTLYRLVEAGRIGYVRVTERNIRISREQVATFLKANTHEPGGKEAPIQRSR